PSMKQATSFCSANIPSTIPAPCPDRVPGSRFDKLNMLRVRRSISSFPHYTGVIAANVLTPRISVSESTCTVYRFYQDLAKRLPVKIMKAAHSIDLIFTLG